MGKLYPIVEGKGEVKAVPILLRKLQDEHQRWDFQIARPIRALGEGGLTKHLERYLSYAVSEPDCVAILVLRDANGDCPKELAPKLADRARSLNLPCPVAIVIAKCEYEAWFLASLESLKDKLGLPADTCFEGDVEAVRNTKSWLSQRMGAGRGYKETQDQAPMTALMDFSLVQSRSRSFCRLEHAFEELIDAIEGDKRYVTPKIPKEVA